MLILLLLVISICAGLLLRRVKVLRHLETTATWTVWLLIFVFGISLGSNEAIVSDFARFGYTAAAVALAGVAGSVLAAWGVRHYVDKGKGKGK